MWTFKYILVSILLYKIYIWHLRLSLVYCKNRAKSRDGLAFLLFDGDSDARHDRHLSNSVDEKKGLWKAKSASFGSKSDSILPRYVVLLWIHKADKGRLSRNEWNSLFICADSLFFCFTNPAVKLSSLTLLRCFRAWLPFWKILQFSVGSWDARDGTKCNNLTRNLFVMFLFCRAVLLKEEL